MTDGPIDTGSETPINRPPAPDALAQLSDVLAARVAATAPFLAAISLGNGRHLSAILWRADAIVTSEQALPDQPSYPVAFPDGTEAVGRLAGRDTGTNVAVLRLDPPRPQAPRLPEAGEARAGTLALAVGAHPEPASRMAMVSLVGPAWTSMAGGKVDRLIRLDLRASRVEEGGPVLDASGRLLGMATAGPRRLALVIPTATIARVTGPLLEHGRLKQGWIGVALQPVAVPESLRAEAGQDSALMVVSLAAGGPAEQAGVLPGDILLSFGEARLRHGRSIRGVLGAETIGTGLDIRLLRGGALQTCRATVAERPAS